MGIHGRVSVLTEDEFSKEVLVRMRRERPEIRVEELEHFNLLIEPAPGKQRIISLQTIYQNYIDTPEDKDVMISNFLTNLVYEEPAGIEGDFAANKDRILPQVVPPSLLEFCERDGRELAAVGFVGELSIAFVVDEPERYCYINQSVLDEWGVTSAQLLAAGLKNLERLSTEASCQQFGTGAQAMFAWETFDGYDASRILLGRELATLAGKVAGSLIIAIPHRDYMVAFGDADPDFVARVQEHVHQDFEQHSYPITAQLFARDIYGRLVPYSGQSQRSLVN